MVRKIFVPLNFLVSADASAKAGTLMRIRLTAANRAEQKGVQECTVGKGAAVIFQSHEGGVCYRGKLVKGQPKPHGKRDDKADDKRAQCRQNKNGEVPF